MNQTTPRRVEGWPSRRAVDCKFGKAEMQRLLESVEKHEQIHSDLAKAALRQMKDPATDIEQSLDKDRAKLKDRVNLFVSTAVSEMSNATVEDLVKAVMRGIPRYVDGACFDFPAWDSGLRDDECFYEFGSLADKVQ